MLISFSGSFGGNMVGRICVWRLLGTSDQSEYHWPSFVISCGDKWVECKDFYSNRHFLIVLFPWLKTKHFKYLPGSDPRHPLQAGQICRAISQLQSSWLWWWERNHNSAGRKEKVVVLNPSHFFYIDNSCILAQSAVNRRTFSHGEDHQRNSWGYLILEMFWRNSHTEPIQTLVLEGITLYFTWFQMVWLLCVLFLTFTLLQQWCNDRFILYRVERTGGVHHPPSDSQLFHTTHRYSQLQPGEQTLILTYRLTQE